MVNVPAAPNSCFWELTARCRLACLHCRSYGGEARADELSLAEALDVADQLVQLRPKFVILTGGEPTLFPGWEQIAARLAQGGIKVRLFTDGYDFTPDTLRAAQEAGVSRFAVSLDGPQAIHDRLRPPRAPGSPSPYERAVAAIRLIVAAGLRSRVVTQVNRVNVDYLDDLYPVVANLGVGRWQLHLCQMTGRAREHRAELMCDPAELEIVVRLLLTVAKQRKLLAPLHCTIGYLTEEEPLLRGRETKGRPVWLGCEAGRRTLAITPTGDIKGCGALPDEFATRSVRRQTLAEIWRDDAAFPYSREWSEELLGGLCLTCPFAQTCRAGCPAVAYGATGSIGANPYCLRIVRGK